MKLVAVRKPLNGFDLFARRHVNAHHAGADAVSFEQDGAGAALAFAAAVFRPGEAEFPAQDAEQAAVAVGVDGVGRAVDVQFLDFRHDLPLIGRSAISRGVAAWK